MMLIGVLGVGAGLFVGAAPATRMGGTESVPTRPLVSGTQGAATRARVSTTQPSDGNKRAHAAWYTACEQRVAAVKGKAVDVMFIGDSITEHFSDAPTPAWDLVGKEAWDKHYAGRNVLNFGVGADRTEHVLWRLENMDVKGFSPKVAVILIGTNNNGNSPEEIAAGVKAVVGKTREMYAGVKVILVSILPNARAGEKMAAANKLIEPLADGKDVVYFDLAGKMVKEGNGWKGVGRDRLHLSEEGYEMWATEMEPVLSKLLGG